MPQALSLDPRSPSGIPRTPILVEEEKKAAEDKAASTPLAAAAPKVKRGSAAPVSKLTFTAEAAAADQENEANEKEEESDVAENDKENAEDILLRAKTIAPTKNAAAEVIIEDGDKKTPLGLSNSGGDSTMVI